MKVSKLILTTLAAPTAALLAACSAVTVDTDADPAAELGRYRTYAWASPDPASRPLSPSSLAALHSTFDSEMAAKGIQKTPKPSFVVTYRVSAREKTDVLMIPNWNWYGGYGGGYYGHWRGYHAPQAMVSQYTEGTLVVDFVDTATSRMIWRGVAKGIVGSAKENQKSITEAVRKMLKDFPPKS